MTTVLAVGQTVSQTPPVTPVPGVSTPGSTGRLGPLFAGIWLFFLLNPFLEGWAHRDEARGILGMVCTLVFAGVYLSLWVRARADRQRLIDTPPLTWSLPYVGALAGLGALTVACVGEPGLACTVYVLSLIHI